MYLLVSISQNTDREQASNSTDLLMLNSKTLYQKSRAHNSLFKFLQQATLVGYGSAEATKK